MGDTSTSATIGHAAGKNGQELGLKNELTLLRCIKREGWVREYEASLITGMSSYMIGKVSRRLAGKGHIYRNQSKNLSQIMTKKQKPNCRERFEGNAGFFLRLTAAGAARVDGKSGKDIGIPASWPHHALAIQTLHYLAGLYDCEFETEASMRHRLHTGKFPDGRLVSGCAQYYFEQERSRKSGPTLRKQTEIVVQQAASGITCFVAYPYPASICGGVDHELRLSNSIRKLCDSSAAQNIKLVRCYFDSLIAYRNMRVSQFEIIDLPDPANTDTSVIAKPESANQTMEFNWAIEEERQDGRQTRIDATLSYGDEIHFEGTFLEGLFAGEYHQLYSNRKLCATSLVDIQAFDEFVCEQKKEIEKQIEGDMRMCAMQAAAANEFGLPEFDMNCLNLE